MSSSLVIPKCYHENSPAVNYPRTVTVDARTISLFRKRLGWAQYRALTASHSCRGEGDADLDGFGFAVLQPFSQHAQGQDFGFGGGLLRGGAVGQHAGELRHLGDPAAVVLTF